MRFPVHKLPLLAASGALRQDAVMGIPKEATEAAAMLRLEGYFHYYP